MLGRRQRRAAGRLGDRQATNSAATSSSGSASSPPPSRTDVIRAAAAASFGPADWRPLNGARSRY